MIFDNDDARAWLDALAAEGDAAVGRALDALADEDDQPSASVSARALAAAESVAATRGKPGDALPAQVIEYAAGAPAASDDRFRRAREAVERVFEDSALRDQVDSAGTYDAWEDAIGDLLDRLEPPGGRKMI